MKKINDYNNNANSDKCTNEDLKKNRPIKISKKVKSQTKVRRNFLHRNDQHQKTFVETRQRIETVPFLGPRQNESGEF